MKKSERTDLANQVLSLLLLINNESTTSGLYKIRRQTAPAIFIAHTDIPHRLTRQYLIAQLDDPSVTLTLRLWNLPVLKIFLRSIIGPINFEQKRMIDHIANYLDVYIDYGTMQLHRERIPLCS